MDKFYEIFLFISGVALFVLAGSIYHLGKYEQTENGSQKQKIISIVALISFIICFCGIGLGIQYINDKKDDIEELSWEHELDLEEEYNRGYKDGYNDHFAP